MTKGEKFGKKAKCKHGHRSVISKSAWCDLNKNCTVLKLLDMRHNPKCNCQRQIIFTLKQFQLEGNGFKITMKTVFKGTEKLWNDFLKPGLKTTTATISAGVAEKTKNPQSAQIISNILKSLTGGRFLNLTDLYGNGLRLKDM